MSDKIGEIALVFYSGGDNMGQIANRMLIEAIFKAKEKLKEKRKTKIENSQKMMENRRNRLSKSKEK